MKFSENNMLWLKTIGDHRNKQNKRRIDLSNLKLTNTTRRKHLVNKYLEHWLLLPFD